MSAAGLPAPGHGRSRGAPRPGGLAGAGTSTRRTGLRVVAAPRRRAPRLPFVLLVAGLLGSGLISLLLINTALAQGAFVAGDLQARSAALADREQALEQQVAALESPSSLASRAEALGMVPSVNPVFIRAADGAVLGVPEAAKAPPPPPRPTAKPATEPAAGPATKPAAKPAAKPSPKPAGPTAGRAG